MVNIIERVLFLVLWAIWVVCILIPMWIITIIMLFLDRFVKTDVFIRIMDWCLKIQNRIIEIMLSVVRPIIAKEERIWLDNKVKSINQNINSDDD